MSELESQPLLLANSFEYGWEGMNLILEREVRGEIPGDGMDFHHNFHFITIALDNVRASHKTPHGWQHIDYQAGDVTILPIAEQFPQIILDRDVHLLELFLSPDRMMSLSPSKELEPQLQVRDRLIEQMGLALYRELKIGGAEGSFYAESMSIALSAHLAQNYSATRIAPVQGLLSTRDLQTVKDYIEANLTAPLTVAELSEVVNLSIHHFALLFRRTVGFTPHQYVLKMRIDRATILLKTTKQPIVTIAHLVGFNTQSHFTRVFHQHTQLTPKQYRDRLR
jgi:AraC family transcriptional regulator